MTDRIVVVGASLGGFQALKTVLGGLPRDFGLPLAVVQHRAIDHGGGELCTLLQRYCALPVGEPEDKEAIVAGRVIIAPADYHLLVEPGSFALSTEAPVAYARPSIDVLFESAAEVYGAGAIGVILTGTNQDGARGLARIKQCGGVAIVQDPRTAERAELPAAALAATHVDRCVGLAEVPRALVGLSAVARR